MAEPTTMVPRITDPNEAPDISNPALRPGTPWGDALTRNKQRVDAARNRPAREALLDGFKSTAAYAVGRNVAQRVDTKEGVLSTIGQVAVAATGQAGKWGSSTWDKKAYLDELTGDIDDPELKDAIMAQNTLEGARLTRGNITADLARFNRMGLDRGAAKVYQFAGMLADVDAPLVLLSGGGFGVAKAAGRVAWNARAGLGATRTMGAVSGGVAGLQAGAAVGALDALNRDTTTWMDGVRMALMTTAAGGAIGAAVPKLMLPMKEIERDFMLRMQRGDSSVWDDPVALRPQDSGAGQIVVDEPEGFLDSFPRREDLPEDAVTTSNLTKNIKRVEVNGEGAGTVSVDADTGIIRNVELSDAFRSRGVGQKLYDNLEQEIGRKIIPSPVSLSESAKRMWRTRLANMPPEEAQAIRNESRAYGKSQGLTDEWIDERIGDLMPADDMSVGAMAAPGTSRASLRVQNPPVVDIGGVNVTGRQAQWISKAREWVFNTGYKERYNKAMESTVNKIFATPWLNPGTNNVMQMVKSGSSVANWLTGTVFEVASGVVRGDTSTAAILMRQYQGRLGRRLNDEQAIVGAWAKENGQATMDPTGNFVVRVKPEGYRQFYREVMLDIDAEAQKIAGNTAATRNANPHVRAAADRFIETNAEALEILKGRTGEQSVRGFESALNGVPYMPYRWHPATFLGALNKVDSAGNPLLNNDMIIDGFANAYMAKGTFTDPTVARQVAAALVDRFTARGRGQDDSILSLFTKDGRDYIEQSLKGLNKYTDQEIENFMTRFDRQIEDRSKIGFAKSRSEIDLNTEIKLRDGSTMKIIDFMDPDFSATQQRYIRQVAGNAALARKGITHRGMRGEIIQALRAEQRSLGETPMDDGLLDAMFSEFDGAAQIGFAAGQSNAGIGVAAELKSLGSLSMLQLNGFAQAAETGVGVFATGLNTWYTRGIGSMIDQAVKTSNQKFFDEMAFMTGMIGKDQYTFRPHLVLDEATDYRALDPKTKAMSQLRGLIAQGNYIQGFTSGLNAVREFQQKVAWLGMSDKIFKTIADDIQGLASGKVWDQGGRMYRDLGLDQKQYNDLRELIENGTIEFKTTKTPWGTEVKYVDALNLHKWDADLVQDFSSALARNEAQLVQRPLAGETDRWMHTHLGALVTHLQTFPILAIQKQGARNAGQADVQAMAQTLGGIASAYVAINLRDVLTQRERTGTERAKAALAYANISGWVPLYSDPIMSALGQHDWRVNGFGAYAEPLSAPVLDIANRLTRVPGAAANAITGGEINGGDRAALRTVPFVRLIEMMTGLAGANLLDDPNVIAKRKSEAASLLAE